MSKEQEIVRIATENPTLSNREIGKMFGITRGTVSYYLIKNNIRRDRKLNQRLNNTDRNTPMEVSERAKEILIGTLLGNSSVTKYRRGEGVESVRILNSCISCGHSLAQKDYVLHLKQFLEKEGLKAHFREDPTYYKHIICGREALCKGRCDLTTAKNIHFNSWRDRWYPDGIKVVPRDIEKYFTPLCIAFWFMDDGCKNNCSYYLHTEGFTIEDIGFLRDLLKSKHNISTAMHKMRDKYTIYVCSNSKDNFAKMILPYMCDSMKYKIFDKHRVGSE